MAKRSTRQIIRDRLEQSNRSLDTARSKIIQAQQLYLEAGEERGLELEPIVGAIEEVRNALARWRIERT